MVLSDGLRWLAIASRSERKSNLEIIGVEVCEIVCGDWSHVDCCGSRAASFA